MPSSFRDREQDKFKETPSGKTSVRVSVDPDSPIPVYSTEKTGNDSVRIFSQALSVPAAIETNIVSYIVPAGKKFVFERISFSGTNIARYSVEVSAVLFDRFYTYWSTSFFGERNYKTSGDGIFINSGQVITLKVSHNSSDFGDFYGSIEGFLIDE